MTDEKITDEMLKQKCLELGYSEERIDWIIYQTNAWSVLCGEYDGYFGRLFGSAYNNEDALRKVIDNWDEDALILFDAIKKDRTKHPEDYIMPPTKDKEPEVNIDEMIICSFPSRMNDFQYRGSKRSILRKKEKEG